ncbi:MAG: ATP-binding cassette domain-containing protein [Thalassobaculaceae bacterium]|nr:ATP-binding cassette domain-containing protein [Thalassobaculaceae bacterium]
MVVRDGLAEALRQEEMGRFEQASDFAACLMPLLTALGWAPDADALLRALPHVAERIDLIDFRNVLAELGYVSVRHKGNAANIDPRLTPCLFVTDSGVPLVILSRTAGEVTAFDSRTREVVRFRASRVIGYYYTFARNQDDEDGATQETSFVGALFRRFHREISMVAITSVIGSLFGVIVPIFVMTVYDSVIPAASPSSLYWLLPGVALALVVDFCLRQIRGASVAHIAGRVDYLLSTELFRKILSLPPTGTEGSTLGAQLSRFRGFQGLRDVMNSPVMTLILEIPLIVTSILVIAIIARPIVLVPLIGLLFIALIGALFVPAIQRAERRSSTARAARDQLATEVISKQRGIRATVLGSAFMERLRPLSARTALERNRSARLNTTLQSLLHGVLMATGLMTLSFGAEAVINQSMTTGALVASMALVWRILMPAQIGCQSLPRLVQMRGTIAQVDRLMRAKSEDTATDTRVADHRFTSSIAVRRVSVRYNQDADPALLAVSLDVKPGEMVALIGPSGSGKSTLLKIMAGLLRPQAGTISFGGVEMRHLGPVEHRRNVGYLSQTTDLFHGTIAQNLRLARPDAPFQSLRDACDRAGVLDEIESLPDAFDTVVGDEKSISLPESFQQKLSLARIWLKDSPVMLLDEPAQNLDGGGDEALTRELQALKGHRTIFFVTHRPSAMRLADRVFELNQGRVTEMKRDSLSISGTPSS